MYFLSTLLQDIVKKVNNLTYRTKLAMNTWVINRLTARHATFNPGQCEVVCHSVRAIARTLIGGGGSLDTSVNISRNTKAKHHIMPFIDDGESFFFEIEQLLSFSSAF